MAIKYLKPTTLKNKTVLFRPDVNVPMDKATGKVSDDFRIEQALPTIKLLQKGENKIIICGHLGRPGGKHDPKYSLLPVAERMAKLLQLKCEAMGEEIPDAAIRRLIFYTGDITKPDFRQEIANAQRKDIIFLENMRFYPGEETNDASFAKVLASMAEAYVNDAFGVDHRKAASVAAVAKNLPCYAGLLLEKEIKSLDIVLHKHKKPFVLMMGGIKISDKVETIKNLGEKADKILLGGGIANLFFLAKGYAIGDSKVEQEAVKTAWLIEKNFKGKIILPEDVVVADGNMDKNSIRVCSPHEVRKNERMLDAGPKTILRYATELKQAKTIVWNGPLGYFEQKPFNTATMALARVIGGVASRKAYAVVGGGETVDAVRLSGQFAHIDHVSTGGGAMLEYLAGKKLPGIEALK